MLSPLHEEKVYIRIVSVMPYYLQGSYGEDISQTPDPLFMDSFV
jgi:hypothetical protein